MTRNSTAADHQVGGCFHLFDILCFREDYICALFLDKLLFCYYTDDKKYGKGCLYMKKDQKKKFRIGSVISIIISAIMLYTSLQPLGDDGAFGRIIVLIPLSIAAWLFFLGRENVFDYRETGETYEEDFDIVTEDWFGGKHLETYTSTHNKSEGGFIEHAMKASWVFAPLCAIDAFLFKGSGGIGFYWLIPVVLIILNIVEIMPDKKSSKDDDKTTTETIAEDVVEDVDDKSDNAKKVEVVEVEGAREQYYFDYVDNPYLLTCDIYEIKRGAASNKSCSITGIKKDGKTTDLMMDCSGEIVLYWANNIHNTATHNDHEITMNGIINYKMIGDASNNYTITDADGNKLAYYKIIDTGLLKQHGIYGLNDEPYVTWSDDKTFNIMKNCPMYNKFVILMIACAVSDKMISSNAEQNTKISQ